MPRCVFEQNILTLHRNSEYPEAVALPKLFFNIVDVGIIQNLLMFEMYVYVCINKVTNMCVNNSNQELVTPHKLLVLI